MTQRTAEQPALLEGSPLPFPEVLDWDLPHLLERASQGSDSHGIRFVDLQGSETFLSYAALAAEATQHLAGLHGRGLRAGDRVLFQLDHPHELITAFWACALGGIVPVILPAVRNPDGRDVLARHLRDVWTLLGRPPILCTAEFTSDGAARIDFGGAHVPRLFTVEDLRTAGPPLSGHRSSPLDLVLLLRTSGSSGAPKLVKLSHRNILASVAGSSLQLRLGPQDVCLNWLPLCHVGALMRSIRDVYLQCQSVQVATDFVVEDPLRWLDLLHRHEATATWSPDFGFGLVVDRLRKHAKLNAWDLHSLRSICSSGEPVSMRTMTSFRDLLDRYGLRAESLHQAWGLTEACSATHSLELFASRREQVPPDVGVPVPGMAVRIVDEEGHVVASGTQGEVQIRGAACSAGYLGSGSDIDDGWFHTQDRGSIASGRLYISARDGQWIVRHGKKYAVAEVETLLWEVLDSDAAFLAVSPVRKPGDARGERSCLAAFFEAQANPRLDQTAASRIKGSLARSTGLAADYLVPVPRELFSHSSAAKSPRGLLRALFEGGMIPALDPSVPDLLGESNSSPGSCARLIAFIFSRSLAMEAVGLDDNFFSLGGNSVQAVQVVNGLTSKFGPNIVSVNDMFRYPTARLMADFVYGDGGNSDPEKLGRRQADARRQASPARAGRMWGESRPVEQHGGRVANPRPTANRPGRVPVLSSRANEETEQFREPDCRSRNGMPLSRRR